jgi:hypothetical protein
MHHKSAKHYLIFKPSRLPRLLPGELTAWNSQDEVTFHVMAEYTVAVAMLRAWPGRLEKAVV